MPFTPTLTLPSDQITVLFKGLVVLSALADGTCEAGIHRLTDDHFLVIEIRARTANSDALVMRHAGPLTRDFTLTVDPPPTPNPGLQAFQANMTPFDRTKEPSLQGEFQDFRWKIDLHDPGFFHPPDTLQPFSLGVRPRVVLSNGTFYTSKLTERIPAQAVSPVAGTSPKNLNRLAAVIGARIELNGTVLRVEGDDTPSPLVLPRPGDSPTTKYEISILNEPLAIGTRPDPDELNRYYDVVRLKTAGTVVPSGSRFRLDPKIVAKTDEIPCMPTVLGP